MNVLVTGGAGFIGSHTVDLLVARGYAVRVFDALLPPVHPVPVWPDYLPDGIERIAGDVRDRDALARALRGVDAVIHLAAYQDYLPDFSTFFHTNAVGTALLYEIIVAERLPIRRVVVASSQAVYGEGRYRCERDGDQYPPPRPVEQLDRGEWEPRCPVCREPMAWQPTDERHVDPHNQYALSKYTEERIALLLGARWGIPSVALRYSITQGARQSFTNAYSGILRSFTVRLLTGQRPVAYEDGQQVRDYVSVSDVARANLLALEDDRAIGRVFNVGSGRPTTVLEYAARLARYLGSSLTPETPGLYRAGDTRHIVSDISALRALGWEPTGTLDAIIAEYVEWARRQPGLDDHYGAAMQRMLATGALRRATT
ncbi:MAG: NAD-dependent epimerase/dehydratase family protein [Chloroflexota bacterium]|nr:NAD-dependent epimerase/dehydratase family protein [Dehalococcoidia bacterium]MDW8253066.1 NAD-dependent epimerase/dehydratase family protein [Chloroflexota bacterium]